MTDLQWLVIWVVVLGILIPVGAVIWLSAISEICDIIRKWRGPEERRR